MKRDISERQVKHAEVIMKAKGERGMGEWGTWNKHPKAIRNAVGEAGGNLQGGGKHRELKITQLECTFDSDGYEYVPKN